METPTQNVPAGTAPVASPTPAAPAPTPAPAAPAETQASTPSTPAASSSPDLKSILGKMTASERLLVATGRSAELIKNAPPAPAAAAPEPVPATPPAEATPAPEAAPVTAEPAPAPQAGNADLQPENSEGKDAGRVRLHGDDYAIAVLAKSKGISIIEAARMYAGQPETAPAASAAPASVVPAVDPAVTNYDTKISEAETQITKLLAERDAASDDLDPKAANKLNDQIADLKWDLRTLKNEKQGHIRNTEQQSEVTYQRGVKEETTRVYEKYPQLAVADSMERLALDAYVQKVIADPKREAELADPRWVSKVAEEFAVKHGIKPKAAGTAPVVSAPVAAKPTITKQPPQQVLQPSGVKLLTGADGQSTPSASRPLTRERTLEMVRNDPAARKAIMRQINSVRK